jgi:hypothetical protein
MVRGGEDEGFLSPDLGNKVSEFDGIVGFVSKTLLVNM